MFAPVVIYSPTNGSVNVSRTAVFNWSGPANFQLLNVVAVTPPGQRFNDDLAPTATNWPVPQPLNYGTNEFGATYTWSNFPPVTFTTPMDTNTLVPLSNFVATVTLRSASDSAFVVGAPAPLPVPLVSPLVTGTNFQFAFQTLAGRPHILQGSTNLVNWVDLTNFIGDGLQQQFQIGRTNRLRYFRVVTQ